MNARRPSRIRRPGGVYVAVLGVALIVSIIGLTALHASRAEIKLLTASEQIGVAEIMAQSAVELALARIALDPDWRDNYDSGVENPSNAWTTLGAGTFKFVIADDDGDLDDDSSDPVTVRGIGRCGAATSVAAVQLQPGGGALNCLDVALHAGGDVFAMNQTITCDQMVSSNDDIFANGGTVSGDAWAVDDIQGSVTGGRWSGMSPPREMPDSATVFDYYLANGTLIHLASIPSDTIDRQVISANNNPYGPTNLQGIYVIDCGNQTLRIRDSRIHATLVVLTSGSTPEITGRIHWDPPATNMPALLVRGNLAMNWLGGSPLSESSLGVNFNPAGSPYFNAEDADATDSYAGVIRGLVYVSGNLLVTNNCLLEGVTVVGGYVNATSAMNLSFAPPNRNDPPPGFSSGSRMRVVPGTWRRVSY